MAFAGGCRCGAVRYQCDGEMMFTGHCHCRDCQYASGGAYSTVIAVARDTVSIEGETQGYEVPSESGNSVTRRFCPTCGSPLFSELSANPDVLILKAASLDDPSSVKPTVHIWTESGQPWAEMSSGLPAFPRNAG